VVYSEPSKRWVLVDPQPSPQSVSRIDRAADDVPVQKSDLCSLGTVLAELLTGSKRSESFVPDARILEEIPAANRFDPRSRRLWEEWVTLLLDEVGQKPMAQTMRDKLTPPSKIKRYRWEHLFRCDGGSKARLFEYQKCYETMTWIWALYQA